MGMMEAMKKNAAEEADKKIAKQKEKLAEQKSDANSPNSNS
jgi:hypothetical protein